MRTFKEKGRNFPKFPYLVNAVFRGPPSKMHPGPLQTQKKKKRCCVFVCTVQQVLVAVHDNIHHDSIGFGIMWLERETALNLNTDFDFYRDTIQHGMAQYCTV